MPNLSVDVPTGGMNVRWVATGLLVLMAIIFVVSSYYLDLHPAVGFIRAFAEAARFHHPGEDKQVVGV